MTVNQSFPWSGITPGQAGPYSDDTFALWVQYGIQQWGDGVVRNALEELEILANSPAAANVVVQTGFAIVQGRWAYNDADLTLAIASNSSGNPRIDTVVIRVDYASSNPQTVEIAIKQGSPAASPVPIALVQNSSLWEIAIGYVAVANGFTTIAQTDITDSRTWCNTPDSQFLEVNNQSATVLNKGNVVIRATSPTSYPIACNTTTTLGNPLALGVIESRTLASGGLGRVITRGITPVLANAAIAVGDVITLATTAGRMIARSSTSYQGFGYALTAASGAGVYFLAYVDFQGARVVPDNPGFAVSSTTNQTVVATTPTLLTWDTETRDSDGWFASNRFTPLIAGWYEINARVTGDGQGYIELRKNGTNVSRAYTSVAAGTLNAWNVSEQIHFDGVTDYVEAWVNQDLSVTVTKTSNRATFHGVLVSRD